MSTGQAAVDVGPGPAPEPPPRPLLEALGSWASDARQEPGSAAPDIGRPALPSPQLEGGGATGSRAPAPVERSAKQGTRLRLTIHRAEGALGAAMATPFVRVHVVDASTGLWKAKASASADGPVVFSIGADGVPFLRTTRSRREPWQADTERSGMLRPFSTEPCALQGLQARWEESFLLAEPPGSGSMLLFEVLDVVEDRGRALGLRAEVNEDEELDGTVRFARMGWGFLNMDSPSGPRRPVAQRRMRIQLHRYRRLASMGTSSGLLGAVALPVAGASPDESDPGCPEVFREYRQPSDIAEAPGVMGRLLGKGRQGGLAQRMCWPAVLEVSLTACDTSADLSAAAHLGLPSGAEGALASESQLAAEASESAKRAKEEEEAALAAHQTRRKGQQCALPDKLLWQVSAGRRGAFRLSLSPSGRLVAVAVARQGGAFELRTFNMATGHQHAICTTLHDTLVYDLCWHNFEAAAPKASRGAASAQRGNQRKCLPLLISCSGDGTVQIYEVPEESGAGPHSLRPHARLKLPGHVYSVRAHPALSRSPERLVLLCGGHGFGIMLCEVPREWVPDSSEGGASGKWVVGAPRFETVQLPPTTGPHQDPLDLGSPKRDKEKQEPPPAVLCVRFSRQPTTPDNMYAADVIGRVMMFQVRFDTMVGGIRASLVRVYSAPFLEGVAVHSMEVVTSELLEGKRLSPARLTTVDDYVLLNSRDHTIRLASLQRGAVSVVRELSTPGFESGNYPVRGGISPDGAYVACGSESGQLFVWKAVEGEPLAAGDNVPRVTLAGPVMDVIWSPHHHFLACCAMDEQQPPLLAFIGGDPNAPAHVQSAPERAELVPVVRTPRRDASPRKLRFEETPQAIASPDGNKWALQWLNVGNGVRSALDFDKKKQMKEQILTKIFDRKGTSELETRFSSVRGALPGGLA